MYGFCESSNEQKVSNQQIFHFDADHDDHVDTTEAVVGIAEPVVAGDDGGEVAVPVG
jgi:hypothetical protein